MPIASPAARRAFVRRVTKLGPVPGVPAVRLHLSDDVTTLWRRVGLELGQADPALPYWAFAWAGGLAIVRYLQDHPEQIEGRRVLDLGAGSGLCAIVASQLGASSVLAVDVDPLAEAAMALNARANGVRIDSSRRDLVIDPPAPFDVIVAGDVCYEETMARRILAWLALAAKAGSTVLLGDPGRSHLPSGLDRLATYEVETSREIEDSARKQASVFRVAAD